MLKNVIFIFTFVLCRVSSAGAETFIVDGKNGNDKTGNGTLASPWKTIQKAADSMSQGDTCAIRASVYREQVRPRSGQSFVNYNQEHVLITGCDEVTGAWHVHHGAIYKTPFNDKVVQLFFNGQRMHKARYPDEDGDMFNKDDWAQTVTAGKRESGTVTFGGGLDRDYVGGFYTGHNGTNAYQGSHGRIIAQSDNQLTLDRINFRWWQGLEKHMGPGSGYIIDHLNALTVATEWHWDKNTLYLYAPQGAHPGNHSVEARVRLWGFDCSGKNRVTIRGLHFKAAALLQDGSDHCTIENCSFRYVSPWGRHQYRYVATHGGPQSFYGPGGIVDGTSGIYINGTGNTIRDSYIAYGWGSLITLRGRDCTVENCYLEEAGWIGRQATVCILTSGANQKILRNTMRKSSSKMIAFVDYQGIPSTGTIIKYNDCRQYAYLMRDGGTACIYTNGNSDLEGAEIAYNLIAENMTDNDRVSCGIYLDDHAHNATVHHNIVHGGGHCRAGLFTHKGNKRIYVYHNTFWDCTQGGWVSAVWDNQAEGRDRTTMVYRNNLSSGRGFIPRGRNDPITEDHNDEQVSTAEFVGPDAYNFRLKNADSPAVDAGVNISGINDCKKGAPDLGAYEYGDCDWRAGSNLRPVRGH